MIANAEYVTVMFSLSTHHVASFVSAKTVSFERMDVSVSSPVLVHDVLDKTAFSASVTKFSSAHRSSETMGFAGSVSSTAMFVPATTDSTVQVQSVGRLSVGTLPEESKGA